MVQIRITVLISCLPFLLYSCANSVKSEDDWVECRLCGIIDHYTMPLDTLKLGYCNTKDIVMRLCITNHAKHDVFVPIQESMHDETEPFFCSEIRLLKDGKPIDCLVSYLSDWDGFLKPEEKEWIEMRIPERALTRLDNNATIRIDELKERLSYTYNKCLSDTAYSSLPLSDLCFTQNDTVDVYCDDIEKPCTKLYKNIRIGNAK